MTAREADLPFTLNYANGPILTLKRFFRDGFSLQEQSAGIEVRAEIYYDDSKTGRQSLPFETPPDDPVDPKVWDKMAQDGSAAKQAIFERVRERTEKELAEQKYEGEQRRRRDTISLSELEELRAEASLIRGRAPKSKLTSDRAGFRPKFKLWQSKVRVALKGHHEFTEQFFSEPSVGVGQAAMIDEDVITFEHQLLMLDSIIESLKYLRGV